VARRELREHTGTATVLVADPPRLSDVDELARAAGMARVADVAVVVVGTTDEIESEGFDRTSPALPGRQDELVRAVRAVNERTVVVVNSGGPVELPWRDEVAAGAPDLVPRSGGRTRAGGRAFRHARAGRQVADDVGCRPAGRAVSDVTPEDGVLRYEEGLHTGYRAWHRSSAVPACWFGHGLGYTTWAYEEATAADQGVRVRVRNTGDRAGREVVEVYVTRPDSAVERLERWLGGWAVASATPGEAVEVDVEVPRRAYRHWTPDGWATEPGPFTLLVGRSAGEHRCEAPENALLACVSDPLSRPPTLEDVARVAGVSRTTVSQVIDGIRNVDHRIQEVVRAAIDQTGYAPTERPGRW
jgi:beta-glucosidase